MNNIHVLVDAKTEYTKQLINILTPRMMEGFQSVYDHAKDTGSNSKDKQILKLFQTYLSDIPKWTNTQLVDEFKRISNKSNCDWLDDLIKAVFVSHTKVLISIKMSNKSKKTVDLSIPKAIHFIHKSYINCARKFWKKPYLFYHDVSQYEIQQHKNEIESIVSSTVEETVRKLLPVRNILREYLGNNFVDDIDDDLSNDISVSDNLNLKKLVEKELEISIKKKKV